MFPVWRVFSFHPLERFLPSAQPSLELARLYRFKNLAKRWAWRQTESDQIVPSHEWRRNDRFVSEFLALPNEKFVVVEHAMAALAVNPVQLKLVVESRPRHKTLQLRHPHLRHVFENHMLPHHFDCAFDFSAGKSQTPHDFLSHLGTQTIV